MRVICTFIFTPTSPMETMSTISTQTAAWEEPKSIITTLPVLHSMSITGKTQVRVIALQPHSPAVSQIVPSHLATSPHLLFLCGITNTSPGDVDSSLANFPGEFLLYERARWLCSNNSNGKVVVEGMEQSDGSMRYFMWVVGEVHTLDMVRGDNPNLVFYGEGGKKVGAAISICQLDIIISSHCRCLVLPRISSSHTTLSTRTQDARKFTAIWSSPRSPPAPMDIELPRGSLTTSLWSGGVAQPAIQVSLVAYKHVRCV
jgi:hypothetical protein